MLDNSNPPEKILLMGLSNSGKTSLLQYFQGLRNIPCYSEIKPTIQIKRVLFQAMDEDFTVWDFGGQKRLIETYLEEFSNYLTGVSTIIFTIDVQDPEKYTPALSYLKDIISLIVNQEKQAEIEIAVYLHKCDPDLFEVKPEITEESIKRLVQLIESEFAKIKIKYSISRTSLFVKFKRSLEKGVQSKIDEFNLTN